MQKFEASAPSNIALIKYMGKIDSNSNQPTNSSLSLTLNELRTVVRLSYREDLKADQWQPLAGEGFSKLNLSEKSQGRFLKHLAYIKNLHHFRGNFLVESGNNFPSDCGLASSASSFAALTMAATAAVKALQEKDEPQNPAEVAELSRLGSGSSCRSFFGPWALWFSEGVRPLEFPIGSVLHQVIIVEDEKKTVSSSEAHRRVVTSDLFEGRPERAEKRLAELMLAFKEKDWQRAYEISWAEFWDMHALFETSKPPFGYMTAGTLKVLRFLQDLWTEQKDGPIVTMDAGANVHLIYRQDQQVLAEKIKNHFSAEFKVFDSSLEGKN